MCKAHRLLYHPTLGSRVIQEKKSTCDGSGGLFEAHRIQHAPHPHAPPSSSSSILYVLHVIIIRIIT